MLIDINNLNDISYDNFLKKINYRNVNSIIEEKANEGRMWLENSLKMPKAETLKNRLIPKVTINDVLKIEKCVGCGKCALVCPASIINIEKKEVAV